MKGVLARIMFVWCLLCVFVIFNSFDNSKHLNSTNLSFEGADQVILAQDVLRKSIFFHIDSEQVSQDAVVESYKALNQHLVDLKY